MDEIMWYKENRSSWMGKLLKFCKKINVEIKYSVGYD
jgi:hypothetical protein